MTDQPGFHWLWPSSKPADEALALTVIEELKLPPPHRDFGGLSLHLLNALDPLSGMLSDRQHINPATNAPFNCLCYFADDEHAQACCVLGTETHVVLLGSAFVRRLVKVAHLLEPTLAARPRMNRPDDTDAVKALKQNADLAALIRGEGAVSQKEVDDIVETWPAATSLEGQHELSGYALFYDLLRLVWMHEWAHALCGHVALAKHELQLARLHEFSTERCATQPTGDILDLPANEILQSLEMHADEFAIRTCVMQMLWGYDPVERMAGPRVDLVDRMLMLNTASCIFAVMWALSEARFSLGDTWRPERGAPDAPASIFRLTQSTHPPAELRYLRFRDFQRDNATKYGLTNGAPQLVTMTDAYSFEMVNVLTRSCGYFDNLLGITPMIARTPDMDTLIAYEEHLLGVGAQLAPHVQRFAFAPTRDVQR